MLFAVLAVFGGPLLLVAGWGDDDGGVETGDVSKQEYVAEGNEICSQGDRRLDRAAEEYFGEELGLERNQRPSQEQITTFVEDEVIPEIQSQVDALGDLEAPEGDAEQIEEILDSAQGVLDEAEDDPSILAREQSDPFAETNRLLDDYGLTECAD
jgi:hypothetical protein